MHISDLHDYGSKEEHGDATKPFLNQGQQKAMKREVEDIIDAEFDRLGEYANEYISDVAARRAERFMERVLKGDADAAMALLGERPGGRVRGGAEGNKPWAQLIHGILFETEGMKLRRLVVEANIDLIESERIADLESVVEGLSRQIRELEKQIYQLEQRL